jgi:hypothetical protein
VLKDRPPGAAAPHHVRLLLRHVEIVDGLVALVGLGLGVLVFAHAPILLLS